MADAKQRLRAATLLHQIAKPPATTLVARADCSKAAAEVVACFPEPDAAVACVQVTAADAACYLVAAELDHVDRVVDAAKAFDPASDADVDSSATWVTG